MPGTILAPGHSPFLLMFGVLRPPVEGRGEGPITIASRLAWQLLPLRRLPAAGTAQHCPGRGGQSAPSGLTPLLRSVTKPGLWERFTPC